MSAQLPLAVAETALSLKLQEHLSRLHQGKVRDTYALPGYPNLLLVVTMDRISIFDFVLNAKVPEKGTVLNVLTRFWLCGRGLRANNAHHLVSAGRDIDQFLPQPLRGNPSLQMRAMVVKKLTILPVECIARGYLTGSGWKSYQKTGTVCGIQLPPGLHDGSKLPYPIFTPTTKAQESHDEHLNAADVISQYGQQLEAVTLMIYKEAASFAENWGVIIADTKFEFGFGQEPNGRCFTLADEVLTPDSSRFWDEEDWKKAVALGKSPAGWDKQPVREWGNTVETPFGVTGISRLDPADPDHIAFVHSLPVPVEVTSATTRRYLAIFKRLTGYDLHLYLDTEMNVRPQFQSATM